jgi:hypothetical protein
MLLIVDTNTKTRLEYKHNSYVVTLGGVFYGWVRYAIVLSPYSPPTPKGDDSITNLFYWRFYEFVFPKGNRN